MVACTWLEKINCSLRTKKSREKVKIWYMDPLCHVPIRHKEPFQPEDKPTDKKVIANAHRNHSRFLICSLTVRIRATSATWLLDHVEIGLSLNKPAHSGWMKQRRLCIGCQTSLPSNSAAAAARERRQKSLSPLCPPDFDETLYDCSSRCWAAVNQILYESEKRFVGSTLSKLAVCRRFEDADINRCGRHCS